MRCSPALLLACALPAQTAWTPLPAAPTARGDHAIAFDPVRNELVLLGGWDGTANLADTWTFDGTAWTLRAPPSGPGPISSHRLAFDPLRGEVIVFGGWNGTSLLAGTWSWNGSTWTRLAPAHVPPPRYSHALATDTARGRVVLFGGFCGNGCALDDTWEWDGTDWLQQQPAVRPTGRYSAGMAFDERRARVLLFGGRTLAARVNDSWTWDGAAWTPLGTGGPAPRSTPAIAYDPLRQRAVLFGGFAGAYANDTWEHDGTAWAQRSPANAPAARGFAALAFVPQLQRTVLFGGENGGPPLPGAHSYGANSPARATAFGSGCGSGITLAARDLAWTGDTCRLVAGSLPAGTLGAFVGAGFSAASWNGVALPYDLTAHGLPGCTLLAAPDVTAFVLALPDGAHFAFVVPAVPALLGVHVYAQAMATDAAVAPGGFGASAALDLVVGAR